MKVSPSVYQRARDWHAEGRAAYYMTCTNTRCLRPAWTANISALCGYCGCSLDVKNSKRYTTPDDLIVTPTSFVHVTADQLSLSYDEEENRLLVMAPPMSKPVSMPWSPDGDDYAAWLGQLLADISSGALLDRARLDLIVLLGDHNVHLLPEEYSPYVRQVLTPEGVWVEMETRLYPDVTLHERTTDRVIHVNVAGKTHPAVAHRTHVAEIRTQLSEHQYALAYLLVDRLGDKLELGRLKLETAPLLAVENLTPDDIELLLKEPIT